MVKNMTPDDQHFVLSSLPPSSTEKRLALAVVLVLVTCFFITAGPLSSLQLARIDAFIPAYAAALFVNDLVTAVLLFAQFSILRSRGLLVLSSGYLFTAMILIPWLLTFPGVFAPRGLLGAGLQTTAWLYVLWHAGFSLFVIAYVLLKEAEPPKRLPNNASSAIAFSCIAVIAGTSATTFLIIAADPVLPRLLLDPVDLSPVWQYAAAFVVLVNVVAIVVLWSRQRSVLDLWLMVVLCAYMIEILLISFPVPARYSVGWYAGRIYGVLSASLLLIILLYETTRLYGHLLHAVIAQRREREARLATGDALAAMIAHEVKQPLAAIQMYANAGTHWLDRSSPELNEAKAALQRIATNVNRASDVIGGIRAIFKRDTGDRAPLDLNELITEVLALARADIQRHGVVVRNELSDRLPLISASRIQLQQVLLNLIVNAVESMASMEGARLLCTKSETHGDQSVKVSISDTGAGISGLEIERIFDPLFTTKADGMGMGLSICRSIVDAHNGQIHVTANTPRGAVFQLVFGSDVRSSQNTLR
jgi:signal transduction histidine kinase